MADLVGVHCAFSECRQIDFLPFKCESCGECYCGLHRTREAHRCQGEDVGSDAGCVLNFPSSSNPTAFEKCSFSKCSYEGAASTLTVCRDCGLLFCVSHRAAESHSCEAESRAAVYRQQSEAFVQRTLKSALGEEAAARIARRREDASSSRKTVLCSQVAPQFDRLSKSQILIERLKVKAKATRCASSSDFSAQTALPLKFVLPALSDSTPLQTAPQAWKRAVAAGGAFLYVDKTKPLGFALDCLLSFVGLPVSAAVSSASPLRIRWGLRKSGHSAVSTRDAEAVLDLQVSAGSQLEPGDCVELFFDERQHDTRS